MKLKTILMLLALAVLLVVPLLMHRPSGDEEIFGGSDGQAQEEITRIAPDYEPWFEPLFEPPSGEIESMLFTLQAALGTRRKKKPAQ